MSSRCTEMSSPPQAASIDSRVDLEELDAKWTDMWQHSSVQAAAMQSEVSRMGGMVSEASAAAKAASQMVAALTEAVAPLQQRLAVVEQQQQQPHAQSQQPQQNSVPTINRQQEAPVPAAAAAAAPAAPAAPAPATWAHHGGDYQQEEKSSDGGFLGSRQLERLEERLLSRLQRMLRADGDADGQPFRRVRPGSATLALPFCLQTCGMLQLITC